MIANRHASDCNLRTLVFTSDPIKIASGQAFGWEDASSLVAAASRLPRPTSAGHTCPQRPPWKRLLRDQERLTDPALKGLCLDRAALGVSPIFRASLVQTSAALRPFHSPTRWGRILWGRFTDRAISSYRFSCFLVLSVRLTLDRRRFSTLQMRAKAEPFGGILPGLSDRSQSALARPSRLIQRK